MATDRDYAGRLTQALVDSVGAEHLYLTDAQFKHSVDLLVRLLPLWVAAIAEAAAEDAQVRQEAYEALLAARQPQQDTQRFLRDLGLAPRDPQG